MKLIDKAALVAEIESFKSAAETMLTGKTDLSYWKAQKCLCERFLSFIDTLEVKEIDLEKEYKDFIKCDNGRSMLETAKHFFELGLSINNPITAADRGIAEEIIINLKRVEKDYRINLAKEMEWLRNKVKKG